MSREPDDFDELLADLAAGRLAPDAAARLRARITADEAARHRYLDVMQVHALLRWRAGGVASSPAKTVSARRRRPIWVTLFAAACLGMIVLGIDNLRLHRSLKEREAPLPQKADAVLAQAAEVDWLGRPTPRIGTGFTGERLAIAEGLLQLAFANGASVLVEGPADLEILGPGRMRCHRGKIRADVPPPARGFTVETPGADVIDLGPEFALEIGADGHGNVFVIDGEVELHDHGTAGTVRTLRTGHGIGFGVGRPWQPTTTPPDVPNPLGFSERIRRQADASRQRWLAAAAVWQEHPSLVLHYDFEGSDPWEHRLTNRTGDPDGVVVGCRRSTGRWANSNALDFKSVNDRVRLQVPQETDAITLAAWLRIDGFDRRWSALVMSDGWAQGDLHWQFSREGELILGVRHASDLTNYFSPPVLTEERLGDWLFVAVAYDGLNQEVRHYLDGEEVSREAIDRHTRLRLGDAELGNWSPGGEPRGTAIRGLNGRFDDVFIFTEALSPDRIADLYQQSRHP